MAGTPPRELNDVSVEARNRHAGITAAEVLGVGGNRYGAPSPRELHQWLVDSGFAQRDGRPDRRVPKVTNSWVGNPASYFCAQCRLRRVENTACGETFSCRI